MKEKDRKGMSSFDLLMVGGELDSLSGGRMQKVFQKGKHLRFETFVPGKGARELLFEPGRFFITQYKREASNERFSQYLRKHLSGQRIASIRQIDFERIIEIETEKSVLILELFSKGNAIFCDNERMILMPLEMQEWKGRKIAPRLPYKYPPPVKNPFAIGFDELRSMLDIEKGMAAFLATALNLSGKYAEEVCARAGVEKGKRCRDIDGREAEKLFDMIQSLPKNPKPNLIIESGRAIDFAPIEMEIYKDKEKRYFATFNEALDEFFSTLREEEISDISKIKGRHERIIEMQKSAIEKWLAAEEEYRKRGKTVQSNIEQVQEIIDTISRMRSRGDGWEKIKPTLKEKTFGDLKVSEIKEKEGVSIVSGVEIDFRKSARENTNDYFEMSKRARRKKEAAEKALEKAELEMKEAVAKQQEKPSETRIAPKRRREQKYYEKFRWFFTSDNFLVIGGRDATQNEMIFKKHIEKNDIVLHAEIHGAPLTVMKAEGRQISESAIREAAEFAAAYSSAWKRRLGSADVYWISPEQVSKRPPAGTSLAKGAFMIYGQKNYIRNIELKLAIGAKFDQDREGNTYAYPVSGPVQSIGAHAKHFITTVPGTMPHGELAKQIRARLAEKAAAGDKRLIESMPESEIERLLPAGGSGIAG